MECIKPTREELADVLGIVNTTLQFSARPRVVDSDLRGRVIHRLWFHQGKDRSPEIRTHNAFFLPVHFE